ncbi:hypothetical protein FZ103_08715 [Streptomonospora sp. PA3]|uniref:hypothetical protein n=1 Tax=Streptomonospora sp. PA3 TaxID=2607326 RepID=UPI0012DCC231|nr:hypothetical protein [Streptomonospora sp. PA3]MUL41259.1 hypothetical protein [Streptomonospora sp. PA3]
MPRYTSQRFALLCARRPVVPSWLAGLCGGALYTAGAVSALLLADWPLLPRTVWIAAVAVGAAVLVVYVGVVYRRALRDSGSVVPPDTDPAALYAAERVVRRGEFGPDSAVNRIAAELAEYWLAQSRRLRSGFAAAGILAAGLGGWACLVALGGRVADALPAAGVAAASACYVFLGVPWAARIRKGAQRIVVISVKPFPDFETAGNTVTARDSPAASPPPG